MKKFIAIFMVVILGVSLCACGEEKNERCRFCENTKVVTCLNCNAFGDEDCDECIAGKEICSKCDGEGTYLFEMCDECTLGRVQNPVTWEWFTCTNCGGDGEVPADCPQCDGTGHIDKECSACDGKGNYVCTVCNGTKEHTCWQCHE